MAARNPVGPAADRDQLTGSGVGYSFNDPALLREALTHRSAVPRRHGRPATMRSNERLEFVGDRVLGLVMVEWLAELYPAEPEGLLARRHADLVAEHQLAAVGTTMGIPELLYIGPNEARAGVGRGTAVIADAVEAVLGAIYYDGGLAAARQFVRTAWAGAIGNQPQPPKHPKSDLKEWLEAQGATLPPFVVAERNGPAHAFVFTVTVSAMGRIGSGVASTKQAAERDAAADLLQQLQA